MRRPYRALKRFHTLSVITLLSSLLIACSHPTYLGDRKITPLETEDGYLYPEIALNQTEEIKPLVMTAEMKTLVDNQLRNLPSTVSKVRTLHQLIINRSLLGVEYHGDYTATAREAFSSQRANCLGFSHLFVAMARHAGIDANYQQVILKPDWQSFGDILLVRKHVNVTGSTRRYTDYTVDIDESSLKQLDRAYRISDAEALAQHYNNLAVDAIGEQQLERAYGLMMRAMALAPDAEFLWTNLGYLYRINEQLNAAEQSYQIAIQLNKRAYSAMQNMVVLLTQTGNTEASEHYFNKLDNYRRSNPFYHARTSLSSAHKGEWEKALSRINKAIKLKPNEFDFQLVKLGYQLVLDHFPGAELTLKKITAAATPHQQKRLRDHLQEWDSQGYLVDILNNQQPDNF